MGSADKRSGRVTFDDRGDASWEWQTDTGMFDRAVDSQRLRALTESAHLSLADDPPAGGGDPRQRSTAQAVPRRRSIDDLRKLSEQIKRARELKSR